RRNQRITQQQYNQVVHFIKKDWSPAQVVGRMKRYKQPTISHESIYQFIWRDKANGGTLWKHLRQSTKQRRNKGTSMATLTQAKCNAIAHKLNNRPRARLGFQTPEECFVGYYR
ncbi:IS30 family transposase, partial [Vibrio cholerae]|nr:IS30 family transposase [Vibrio cholerae]